MTNTSTRETSEKGNGASVRRRLRTPALVPDESLQPATPTALNPMAARNLRVWRIYISARKLSDSVGFAARGRLRLTDSAFPRSSHSSTVFFWAKRKRGRPTPPSVLLVLSCYLVFGGRWLLLL